MKIKTYKPSEINSCREASKISATILDELNHLIAVGITTDEIDNFCFDRIKNWEVCLLLFFIVASQNLLALH